MRKRYEGRRHGRGTSDRVSPLIDAGALLGARVSLWCAGSRPQACLRATCSDDHLLDADLRSGGEGKLPQACGSFSRSLHGRRRHHPYYVYDPGAPNAKPDDVVVLTLEEPLTLGSAVQPIPLVLTAKTASKKKTGKRFVTIIMGTAKFSMTAGKATIVRLKLNKAGRALLSALRGTVGARLTITEHGSVPERYANVRILRQKTPARVGKR